MFQNQRGNSEKGISVIEILFGVFLLALVFASLGVLFSLSLNQSDISKKTALANALTQETLEAVRNFRDEVPWSQDDANDEYDGLGVVLSGTDYHPRKSSSAPFRWQLVQGKEQVGIFERWVVLENGLRNGSGDIVESGGTPDPNTKKITATVSWSERGRSHEVQLLMYLTNWRKE